MKIKTCQKLACNLYKKEKHVVYIRTLKQALNHELIFKNVHRAIEFNQEMWLKECTDMNTKLKTEVKFDFEKYFFKLINNPFFGKLMRM